MHVVKAALAGAVALCACASDEPPAASSRVERAVAEFAAANDFHGVVLVAADGARVYEGAFGLAERAFATPMRMDTRFRIASITKTFTAVLVMQLVDAGRIDLDAPISAYLADYAGEGARRVRVRQLLNHTSGISNMDTVGSYEEAVQNGLPAYQLPHSSDALVAQFASGALVSTPGETFSYNNADYIILGKIIERVTGQSYEDNLKARILEPLGLADTGMLHQPDILPRLATTYLRPGGETLVNDMPVYMENWYAAGGMYATADDILTFSDALFGRRLTSAQSLDAMLTPGLDGYGFSMWCWDIEVDGQRHRTAERFGSIMGANAVMFRLRDDDAVIIILSNTNTADMRDFAVHVATALLQ